MPQGFPITEGLTMHQMPDPITTMTHTSVSISMHQPASSMVFVSMSGAQFSSLCDTMTTSIPGKHSSSSAGGIEMVIVSTTNSLPVSISHTSTMATSTVTVNSDYKLSEIVSRGGAEFWKNEAGTSKREIETELVPMRSDVLSVQRRSRQFFTLMEDDDEMDYGSNRPKFADDEPQSKNVLVDPLMGISKTMRRLTRKNDYGKLKMSTVMNKNPPNLDRGYESEPETDKMPVTLLDHVEKSGLRRISSHPELDELELMAQDNLKGNGDNNSEDLFENYALGKSKSLPTTPRVSPKLLRKNRTSNELESPSDSQNHGAGYSFLASVIGGLRVTKAKQEQQRKDAEQRLIEKKKQHDKKVVSDQAGLIVPRQENQVVMAGASTSSKTATVDTLLNSNMSEKVNETQSKSPPKKSFLTNVMNWSTQKQVDVSRKESNMWSPTSF
ncbi:hypothetical protein MAR_015768 [Mya arenaria]|uniref:Uncharacterized protein n=1 Tax=Mya arenaria TaxID=6604 RepID=A0ABY7FKC1_MYAAR|nr:uncharacterized protein LOC128211420 [Mya arenaria]WAR21794.1 hypothetical protein MAR_015768 [Mya arenaria]